jgi:MYXO-CTERM domain-containing protein
VASEDSGTSANEDSGFTVSPSEDSGSPATTEDGGGDAGTATSGTGSSSGCSCTTAGHGDDAPSGARALAGFALGLGWFARRRKKRATA